MYEKKDIPGYEGLYHLDPGSMTVVNSRTGRVVKPVYDRDGYAEVKLWTNNEFVNKRLHRLFAEAYIPNPNNYPVVNHKDENRANYSIDNLEWCTRQYNQRYGTANDRRGSAISEVSKGKSRPWAKDIIVKGIIAIAPDGTETIFPSEREASRQLGIAQSGISRVLHGRTPSICGYSFRYADNSKGERLHDWNRKY